MSSEMAASGQPVILERLSDVERRFRGELARVSDDPGFEALRVGYFGKKGELSLLLKELGSVSAEERPGVGARVNGVKKALEAEFDVAVLAHRSRGEAAKLDRERLDVSLPGTRTARGRVHPLNGLIRRVLDIFGGLGYDVALGPLVETDFCNFEALNIPRWHPARDMQDSFYAGPEVVLRTHTSGVQIRTMLAHRPPIRIVAPGRVFRVDEIDATHSPVFHQVEGLVVDRNLDLTHLKGTLAHFARELFGPRTRIRFRPSFFPFTEPSAEVDVTCPKCWDDPARTPQCRVCKASGMIEVLGAGMVHEKVLENVGIDPREWSGFAFGMGVERIAMVLHGIDDIRHFTENDLRFLEQFQGA